MKTSLHLSSETLKRISRPSFFYSSALFCFQKAKLSRREIIQEMNDLGPYLARIGNPTHISKTEAYLLRDDCLSDFKQGSIDKANRILRMIEKQTVELEKMQALLTQVRQKLLYICLYPTFFSILFVFS